MPIFCPKCLFKVKDLWIIHAKVFVELSLNETFHLFVVQQIITVKQIDCKCSMDIKRNIFLYVSQIIERISLEFHFRYRAVAEGKIRYDQFANDGSVVNIT